MKDQIAAGNMLFQQSAQQQGTPNMPLGMDPNANQLALLQSFTSEMTIPTQAQLYHHHQQQQQQHAQQQALSLSQVKTEINNNGDEQTASGSQ